MWRLCLGLILFALCANAEHRITQLIPFGESNLKIVFANDIKSLDYQVKKLESNKFFIDIEANLTITKRNFNYKDGSIIQVAQNSPKVVRIVLNLAKNAEYKVIKEKANLYIYIKSTDSKSIESKPKATKQDNAKAKSADSSKLDSKIEAKAESSKAPKDSSANIAPNTTQSKAVTQTKRAKNHKKIVVDAGHGGKDCGTISVDNVCEKIIVLEVAKALSAELKNRGYVVYMTRNSDIYIDLRKRTEFANTKNADLFVSIHANAMPKDSPKLHSANGVETYFLSPARSERAEQVAKAENQGDIDTMSHFATKSFLNTISAYHLVASHKLAIDIQSGILNEVRQMHDTNDGAVREGPFWVLAGALMPSVLIEIGYASHKQEGKLIAQKHYQRLLANGIANGVDDYFDKNQ